jgi:hypothetical protein
MFDREQRAEIRALCHDEMKFIHRMNITRGSYRYLCVVGGRPIYSHTPVGDVLRDFDEEPLI